MMSRLLSVILYWIFLNTLENEHIEIRKISLDGAGNVYLTGEESYGILNYQGQEIVLNPPGGAFLLKFSTDGELLWGKALGLRFYSYLINIEGYFHGAYFFRDTYEDGFVIIDNSGEFIFDQSMDEMEIQNLSMDQEGNIFYHGWFTGNITIENELIAPQPGDNYLVGELKTELMTSYTNIQKPDNQSDVLLYPNPASERVRIIWPDHDGILEVTIFDISGIQVFCKQVSDNSFSAHSLPPGYYLIRIQSKDQVCIEKLLVH